MPVTMLSEDFTGDFSEEGDMSVPFLSDVRGSISSIVVQGLPNSMEAPSIVKELQCKLQYSNVIVLGHNRASGSRRMPSWPQDCLTVRDWRDHSVVTVNNPDGTDWYSGYFREQIHESDVVKWAEQDEYFPTQGGNMHVVEDIVFVGKNDLAAHSPSGSERDASNAVLKHVFGSASVGKVVWVGTHKQRSDLISVKTFQPAYHTDLFFCPIDIHNGVLRFLFATPDHGFSIVTGTRSAVAEIDDLKEGFDETLRNLQDSLKAFGIKSQPIHLHMPIWFNRNRIKRYWSHANGLVENHSDGIRFLIPWFTDSSTGQSDWHIVDAAQNVNFDQIFNAGIQPVTISGFELDGDALGSLRCQVKVLHRSY